MKRFLLFFLFGVFAGIGAKAQYSLTGTTYTQDFNGLGTATSTAAGGDLNLVSSTLNGWFFAETGASANTTITAGTGSSTAGDTYNFGSAAAADRALGGLQSGSVIPTVGFYFTNNTGAPITDLTLSYTGEQWRLGALARVDRLDFQYSTNATSLTTGTWLDFNSLDFTAPVTGPTVGALDGNLTANRTAVSATITGINLSIGATLFIRWVDNNAAGSDDGLGVDDLTITATLGSTNTITTGTVTTPPFVLASCAATATGTVAFTSTGTFNGGNTYTAQLSDDIGSFTTPVVIGTLVSTANTGTINITIPAGTAGGAGYKIRVVSDNPIITGSQSTAFTITQNGPGGCSSSHTDYYRSFTSGDWSDPTAWESSPDNTTWISATISPTFNANTILIRNGHTINIDVASSADQLTVQSGGVLNHANGSVFTLNDGTGTDMTVNSGGIYVLNGTQPGGTGTTEIQSGGTVRVDSNPSPTESDDYAFGNANVIFRTGSIYDWATSGFTPSWSGRVYFTSAESPTFRFSQTPNFALGGGTLTIVYGYLEVNANITLQGAGTKTFTNGIIGTAKVDASGTGNGNIIINGNTALLAGDSLKLLAGNLLQIGLGNASGTTITMTSGKIISGDVQFSTAPSYIVLGNNTLNVTGSISGYGTTAYVRTNGTGYLRMNGVGGTRVFPVGVTSINPLYINNGNLADYSVRVENGISPAIAFPTYGINRTWSVFASAVTPGVELGFMYAAADANAGATPQPQNMEVLAYTGSAWSITTGNTSITPTGTDPYLVTTPVAGYLSINTSPIPYALGISGGWILPIDCVISTRAQKRNNGGLITWTVNSCSEVTSFEVQRSVNGGSYESIGSVRPSANETDFSFNDPALANGRNLYRIKVNRLSGAIKYSNTVALIANSNDILITSISPNPLSSNASLTVSASRQQKADFQLVNSMGVVVKYWSGTLNEGNTSVPVSAENLPAGRYTITVFTENGKAVSHFIKQ